jgi:hypothetical protein
MEEAKLIKEGLGLKGMWFEIYHAVSSIVEEEDCSEARRNIGIPVYGQVINVSWKEQLE